MTDILQVDAEALLRLGTALTKQADAIAAIAIDTEVVMPGSPVQSVSAIAGKAAIEAFAALGSNIRQMADVTRSGAKSYEEVDHMFAEHFRRLGQDRPRAGGPR